MTDDPDIVRLHIRRSDRERFGYAAHQAGRADQRAYLEELIHRFALTFPAPPPPPRERRTLSEVRAQRRAESGGVSAYTAAITVIPSPIHPDDIDKIREDAERVEAVIERPVTGSDARADEGAVS